MKNYYKILDVPRDASQRDIKKAYRMTAKKYHPDVTLFDKTYAQEKLVEVNEAYAVLSDEERRRQYDAKFYQETFSFEEELSPQPAENMEERDGKPGGTQSAYHQTAEERKYNHNRTAYDDSTRTGYTQGHSVHESFTKNPPPGNNYTEDNREGNGSTEDVPWFTRICKRVGKTGICTIVFVLVMVEAGVFLRISGTVGDWKLESEINERTIIPYARWYCQSSLTAEQLESEIAKCTEKIQQNPGLASAYLKRGRWYDCIGNRERAIDDYTTAIELRPQDANAYCKRGISYVLLGDYEQALADFTEAVEVAPSHEDPYFVRGMFYIQMKDYASAIADYTKAIEEGGSDAYPIYFYYRGLLYTKTKDYASAIADYTKGIKLKLDPRTTKKCIWYYARSEAYKKRGDYTEAMADYMKAIAIELGTKMKIVNLSKY